MPEQPNLVLHVVPFSHPCLAVTAALDRAGLEYETVTLPIGKQGDEIERIYGEGRRTVPALLVDDEPVHGTIPIFERLDELAAEAELYPEALAGAIREAEEGVAEDLQTAARYLTFGALHFRPEALGSFGGAGPLDPAGTDFAIRMVRGAWRYLDISAERIAAELAKVPDSVEIADELVAAGILGGDEPTAADFQIGSSLRLLLDIGDLRPLIEGHPCAALAELFEPSPADIPAGAFPAGWVPEAAARG
ncbi:MAG: glutathione S-transferase family protein [Solirubrobacterales bacterium]|nr:glutathione S-transferase family protein [Solirubrobacterales bacterium]